MTMQFLKANDSKLMHLLNINVSKHDIFEDRYHDVLMLILLIILCRNWREEPVMMIFGAAKGIRSGYIR